MRNDIMMEVVVDSVALQCSRMMTLHPVQLNMTMTFFTAAKFTNSGYLCHMDIWLMKMRTQSTVTSSLLLHNVSCCSEVSFGFVWCDTLTCMNNRQHRRVMGMMLEECFDCRKCLLDGVIIR